MPSSNQKVWLITGASSPLGYRLVLAAIARRDIAIAIATTQEDVTHLQSNGAYAIRIDSQMTYSHIKGKLQQAVENCGKIDFVIHNADVDSRRISSSNESHIVYYANTYTFTTIQVTRAAAEASRLKAISIIVPDFLASDSQQSERQRSSLQGTAQLVASYKLARTSFVVPWAVSPSSASSDTSTTSGTVVINRIMSHILEKAPTEHGIRVL